MLASMIVAISLMTATATPKPVTYTMTIGKITVVPNAPKWTCGPARELATGGTVRDCK